MCAECHARNLDLIQKETECVKRVRAGVVVVHGKQTVLIPTEACDGKKGNGKRY